MKNAGELLCREARNKSGRPLLTERSLHSSSPVEILVALMTCCQGNTIVCTTIYKPAIDLNQGQLEHKFILEKIKDRIQSLWRRQMRLNCNVIITIRVVAFSISEMKCNLSAIWKKYTATLSDPALVLMLVGTSNFKTWLGQIPTV